MSFRTNKQIKFWTSHIPIQRRANAPRASRMQLQFPIVPHSCFQLKLFHRPPGSVYIHFIPLLSRSRSPTLLLPDILTNSNFTPRRKETLLVEKLLRTTSSSQWANFCRHFLRNRLRTIMQIRTFHSSFGAKTALTSAKILDFAMNESFKLFEIWNLFENCTCGSTRRRSQRFA